MTIENTADLFTLITSMVIFITGLGLYWRLSWFSLIGMTGIVLSNSAFLFIGEQYAPQVEIGVSISTIILMIGIWRQNGT
jgi:hypothetical protein